MSFSSGPFQQQQQPQAGQAPSQAPQAPQAPEQAPQPEKVAEEPYYCPACGQRVEYRQQCTGQDAASPHPPTEVVSTDELNAGDPAQHTAAPDSPGV